MGRTFSYQEVIQVSEKVNIQRMKYGKARGHHLCEHSRGNGQEGVLQIEKVSGPGENLEPVNAEDKQVHVQPSQKSPC